jgi:hypothetical protein
MVATREHLHALVDELAASDLPRAAELLERLRTQRMVRADRYARGLAKLDPQEEKALAEEYYASEEPWPEY